MSARDDFLPSCDLQMLKTRAELLKRTRAYFDQAGFVEVQTPVLSQDTMVDRHIEPIRLAFDDHDRYLQTSPEFAMKRLVAAGMQAIYQICPAFRAGERGRRHNPEFTMLEWYRVGDTVDAAIEFTGRLVSSLLQQPEHNVLTYEEAFESTLDINPFRADERVLGETIRQNKVSAPANLEQLDRDELLDILLAECIQPQLGSGQPTILCDYPASQAALAQRRSDRTDCAERFELYVEGYELANGYGELLDPQEMLARHQEVNEKRRKDGNSKLPEMSYLLKAMEYGLPPCSGVALGFDRLMMVATKADTIDDVLAFPFERA